MMPLPGKTRIIAALFLLWIGGGALTAAHAQQAEDLGPYRVHYSAINTSQLSPEVARTFGIQRSTNRALLNLAVLRRHEGGMDEPARARIAVEAVNIAGQRRAVEMREVTEQEAIYYIGTFRIHNEERITFQIQVQPEDPAEPAREFRFQQQFYVY